MMLHTVTEVKSTEPLYTLDDTQGASLDEAYDLYFLMKSSKKGDEGRGRACGRPAALALCQSGERLHGHAQDVREVTGFLFLAG